MNCSRTFYGREKDNAIYPIGLANLILHGIDEPRIWHGNTLTAMEVYGALFRGAPQFFDCVLMNPPFGGKDGKEAQTQFDYKTGYIQVLFLQHVLKSMKNGSRCGIVLDEGVLFRTNETAFVQPSASCSTNAKSHASSVCQAACSRPRVPGSKTNLVFFTKGQPTKRIWHYDLSDVKVGKKTPITSAATVGWWATGRRPNAQGEDAPRYVAIRYGRL